MLPLPLAAPPSATCLASKLQFCARAVEGTAHKPNAKAAIAALRITIRASAKQRPTAGDVRDTRLSLGGLLNDSTRNGVSLFDGGRQEAGHSVERTPFALAGSAEASDHVPVAMLPMADGVKPHAG
jgi:hypothetical protein